TSIFNFREMKKLGGHDVALVKGDMTSEVGGTKETARGVVNLSGHGKGKFEFQFDPAAGTFRYFKGTIDTDLDMTPQSGGDATKTSLGTTIEMELVD
ncbi:MAG TPA: hypothetical protein VFH33_07890, partial [Candidatus Krumholzibacteria bacterium]|nr:hypothetical protein [Candidatus Krumholzibacteria bacterium]